MRTSDPITNLINAFARLPGIGERTASRLTFFVLNQPDDLAHELARSLLAVKEEVHFCSSCGNLTDEETCKICQEERRDRSLICVVESAPDLRAIERTGDYPGLYHVLGGLISPLDGIGPEELKIRELVLRLQDDKESIIREIILAMSPSVDGEATALYLTRLLKPLGVKVSRIASGIPMGGELEYTDRVTLARAIDQRREL